jgi:hypothetical protein
MMPQEKKESGTDADDLRSLEAEEEEQRQAEEQARAGVTA